MNEDIEKWSAFFKHLLKEEVVSNADFDEAVSKFLKFLKDLNKELPGPQHPVVKFYKLRKKN